MRDRLHLQDDEQPVSPDASKAFTLPSWLYTDPAVFDREKAEIFYRGWVCLAHVSELRETGDYVTGCIADQGVFVVRGRDGKIVGFYNVCQHRAHELLQGKGNVKAVITCPYHAWAYGLDGELRTVRNCADVADFNKGDFRLVPVAVEEVCGLVFVNLDVGASPLRDQAPGLEPSISRYFPKLPEFVPIASGSFDVATNWKARVDNSLECYHCETVHASFCEVVDIERYRSTNQGIVSTHHSAMKSSRPDGTPHDYLYWYVWPLSELNASTDWPMFTVFRDQPTATDRTTLHLTVYGPNSLCASEREELARQWLNNETNAEDVALTESVQRGLRSRGYRQGRFIVDASHVSEHSVHHFHRMVAEVLGLS